MRNYFDYRLGNSFRIYDVPLAVWLEKYQNWNSLEVSR